jgi:perosamine synthetase
MSTTFDALLGLIRDHYKNAEGFVPLHAPLFVANERKYVMDAIDSTYVSSVGKYVDQFEQMFKDYTGASYAIATVNGTAALHISLVLAGVEKNDLVICQPLTFIATCNAISYQGAEPLFIDVDRETLGLSPEKLKSFLKDNTRVTNGTCYHKQTGKRIQACVPMHTFGHPAHLDGLVDVCNEFKIALIEDSAESIGSTYHKKHTGTFGLMGAFSFNGNKTITCGGGGMVITNDKRIGKLAKHLTTQAKVPHPYEFVHDHIGYNYRLPNLNAAMACAQMEVLDKFIASKRALAEKYKTFFANTDIEYVDEPAGTFSNFWLNSILFRNSEQRDVFLQYSNSRSLMTRPVWCLMNKLAMFRNCLAGDLSEALAIESRLVNIPSSARQEDF